MANKKGKAGYLNQELGPGSITPELATLRLAELKENFDYRRIWRETRKDPYSAWPWLRRPGEDVDAFQDRIRQSDSVVLEGMVTFFNRFGLDHDDFQYQRLYPLSNIGSDFIEIMDPEQDLTDTPPTYFTQEVLPLMFKTEAVVDLQSFQDTFINMFDGWRNTARFVPLPYERTFRVDMRQGKARLMAEFEWLIDRAIERRRQNLQMIEKHPRVLKDGYDPRFFSPDWRIDDSRVTIESRWLQLEVWRLRRLKCNYNQIAASQGTSIDTVKKRFYVAFERTQGRPYDSKEWKEFQLETLNTDGKDRFLTFCETCDQRADCFDRWSLGGEFDPCPGYLDLLEELIDQDKVKLRESVGWGTDISKWSADPDGTSADTTSAKFWRREEEE